MPLKFISRSALPLAKSSIYCKLLDLISLALDLIRTINKFTNMNRLIRISTKNLTLSSSNCFRNITLNQKIQQSYAVEACACYSTGRRPGFFSQVLENIKQEYEKNKEMKDSVKKFREEAEKLEQSDALKSARQKFYSVESEATKGTEVLKEKFGSVMDEVGKTEIAKKASKITEDISKTAKETASTISEKTAELGKSQAFQSISQATAAVREEIGSQGIHARVYRAPIKLRKRVEFADFMQDDRHIDANTEAMGVELHKDSKFYQSWENFKNNNAYVNKVLSWKMKYDESENPVIRASRLLTEKVSDIMGGMFSKTELSETLTEICKVEPNFNEKQFLRDCESDIIPNILEAMVRGNLDILKDWCFEGTYNIIATPIAAAQKMGYYLDSKILDIENVDLAMGKVMEQGPVLIITFQAQQIMCVKDKHNKIVEGDEEKVMRVNYVWVLCRDPNDLNPRSAWRLMELSASSQEQFL